MNRIGDRFDQLTQNGGKALVTYLTAGDPNLEISESLLIAAGEAGADVLEVGIPFSDPLADGPSIQAASHRALEAGVRLPEVFELVRRVRARIETPIVLMTYYNPVQKFGLVKFAKEAAGAGADGVIMTDLPPEEGAEWKRAADAAGLATIFLLAPTSTKERIDRVAEMTTGFIYCVSRTGVTGARAEAPEELQGLISAIRRRTDTPVVVGFGISRPEHVTEVTRYADGAVIGSALVDLISRNGCKEELSSVLRKFVKELKQAGDVK